MADAVQKLKLYSDKVGGAKAIDELRGIEGSASRKYFDAFPDILDQSLWNSLVFDLMELFRQPVIDRPVLTLANQRSIKPDDFIKSKDECRLTDSARLAICCVRTKSTATRRVAR